MTKTKKYLVFLLILILGFTLFRLFTYLNEKGIINDSKRNDRIRSTLKSIYEWGDCSYASTYISDVELENKNNLYFPLGDTDHAIVYAGFFSSNKRLNKSQTTDLIEIINDTSSYIWGEVGTFLLGRTIIYYDNNDNPVGITEIDEEGISTYSHPYLKRMKWGSMTLEAYKKFDQIISK